MIGLLSLACVSVNAFADDTDEQGYKMHVSFPPSWKVVSNENNSSGYTVVFMPTSATGKLNEQNLVINYAQGVKSPLNASMQQITHVLRTAACARRDVKVIHRDKNSVQFVASLDKCKNGKSLSQMFKIINSPNGQYSVFYTANPTKISPDMIKRMQDAVKEAGIVAA